jgi:competence protein ComEC
MLRVCRDGGAGQVPGARGGRNLAATRGDAGRGIAPSGLVSWPSLLAKLREWVAAEAGAGRLLPWVPVAFGTGIAFYFAAGHEPVLPVAAVAAAVLCLAAFALRRQRAFPVAVMIAATAAGFATATWRTQRVGHGVLARPLYSVSLSGFVETRDIRERTDRFCPARHRDGKPARPAETATGATVGAQGHRA